MIAEALGLGAALGFGLVSLGVFHPRVPLFGPVVWHGRRELKRVALSFDDGPDPRFTVQVAEALARTGATATFFCVGRHLEQHPQLARELVAAGHELGNHTWGHGLGLDLFVESRLLADVERCQKVLTGLVPSPPRLFRPVVGIRNPMVHRVARALGLTVVTWAVSPRDGAFPFTRRRAQAAAARARGGDIIALHDGIIGAATPAKREETVRQLPALLAGLRARGYEVGTVSSVL